MNKAKPPHAHAPGERRRFSRVHFQHALTLTSESGRIYDGAFDDVSLKGMLFWCDELPKAGEKVSGILPLGEDRLYLRGKVVRSAPETGAAIQFLDMDVESFSHLRRLVTLNMGDPEKIDAEFFSSL